MPRPHHVFFSYAREDAELMHRVRADLLAEKITVWTDEGIEPGTPSWRDAIQNAIEVCKCVIVIFSPDAKDSFWVKQELSHASAHDKTIFPLLARGNEKTSVPFGYSGAQWIDIRNDDYAPVTNKLIPALREYVKPRGTQKPKKQTETARDALPQKLQEELQSKNASLTPPNVLETNLTSPEIIRVLVVDDHTMVTKGLRVLLDDNKDIYVVGEAHDGQAALDICRQQRVDVVLMDTYMPRMDGIEATKLIRESCPNTQVITLTSYNDDGNVSKSFKAGAVGYLMKNVSGDDLAPAVRRAAQGVSTLSPEAAQALISAITKPPVVGYDLSERESEVLALMIEGLNNREIAERFFISGSTVKNHVSSILSKLGTVSRTQAVAMAVENKIIGSD